jgi:hypothetical protein
MINGLILPSDSEALLHFAQLWALSEQVYACPDQELQDRIDEIVFDALTDWYPRSCTFN